LIALDSSVLVRYLVQDNPDQVRAAARLIEDELSENKPGYISLVVLVEVTWVLGRTYGFAGADIEAAVTGLMRAKQFELERRELVEVAVRGDMRHFADRLIHQLGRRAGCVETVTFDRRFSRLPGVRLLEA
jgi:predicted nucleic-acid-binding protein